MSDMYKQENFAGRIGGDSSVYPMVRVRYSYSKSGYVAQCRWEDMVGRGTSRELPNERTASESAIEAAWAAFVNLAEKVHAPREGEDTEWWAARLAEKIDQSRYTVAVFDESDVQSGGGGYLVSFMDLGGIVTLNTTHEKE